MLRGFFLFISRINFFLISKTSHEKTFLPAGGHAIAI